MNFEQIRKRADQLRALPLSSVLRVWGAQPDPQDQHKWHTPRGVLSVTGAKFINWNRGVGGGGAIDLVIHLNNLGFKEALDWLARHFPAPTPQIDQPLPNAGLKLPPPDPGQLSRVRHYLLHQRCLPPTLIDSLIKDGTLYADHRANAVFLCGRKTTPSGPNCGTIVNIRQGPDPKRRVFSVLANRAGLSFESAIDASVALPSIPSIDASPLPASGPTRAGWFLSLTRGIKSAVASILTPPGKPWLAP
jgi:hypothetical protein